MALINCPHCDNQVSDKAEKCPHCGNQIITIVTQEPKKPNRNKTILYVAIPVAILGMVVLIWAIGGAFEREVKKREKVIIERLEDIRAAEQAFRVQYGKYTGSFDTLVNFIATELSSSLNGKGLTSHELDNFSIVPFSDNKTFILETRVIMAESNVAVPVFECRAPFQIFLSDLDRQKVISLIDEYKALNKYPGLKIGDLNKVTDYAGNWE